MPFDFSTAVTGALLSTVVLTLAMAYLSRRPGPQHALRWWTLGSGALALRYLFLLGHSVSQHSAFLLLTESAHVLSAALILQGTVRLVGGRVRPWALSSVVFASLLWTFLGVYLFDDFLVLTVPLYLFSGITLATTGYVMYRTFRRDGGPGHALAALGFLVWGLHEWDYPFLHRAGNLHPALEAAGFLLSNFLQMILTLALIIMAMSRQSRRLARQASRTRYFGDHDLLTGLPNRRSFTSMLDRSLTGEENVLLVCFDLRRFHEINEAFGHKMGDQVLRVVARRVHDICAESDVMARVGGDEFAILVHHSDHDPLHEVFLRRLDLEMGSTVTARGHEFHLDYAAGSACFPRDGETAEELMRNAAASLLDARRSGVRYRDFSELTTGEAAERIALRRDLFSALKHDQFYVAYQPQIDMKTGAVCGVEALLRWRHPARGEIPPSVFVPLAESTEFILLVGEWVLDQATRDMALLRSRGFDLRLSVNVSAVQFKHAGLPDTIRNALSSSGLPPEALEIEITESTVIHDARFVHRVMTELGNLGLQFAIDDFGTGYSSLSVLRRLPFDRLKIDRSFIKGIDTDAGTRNIVEAIVWMGHGLNLRVLAEGVEREEERAVLAGLGCDEVQGFLFGRALPIAELERHLSEGVTPSDRESAR